MKLQFVVRDLRKVFSDKEQAQEWFVKLLKWKQPEDEVELEVDSFTNAQLLQLQERAKAADNVGTVRKLSALLKMRTSAHETKVKRLEMLEAGLVDYIGKLPHKWLFYVKEDGKVCPCYVSSIEYHKHDERHGIDAHTELHYAFIEREHKEEKRTRWGQEDLANGRTVLEALAEARFYPETPELVAQYEAEMERYEEINHLTGIQFTASGEARCLNRHAYGTIPMVRDGEPAKVVMDDDDGEGDNQRSGDSSLTTSSHFWDRKKLGGDEDRDDFGDEENVVVLPVHPYVKVFDLKKHEFVFIHVINLQEYVYDKSLIDKLVLPEEEKDLITILIAGSNAVLEDIVKGKTGGTIIISTGPPGTGKTLSAEVCAEALERPLYGVQCAQLGTDEAALEKQLETVLARAARWKAVLLVDEADVYVHERGADIQQNAIVGVWLRLMEYYRGIMFMTSNRDVIIDDAILSRATAHIRYRIPTPDGLAKLWRILSAQYSVSLSDKEVLTLVEHFLGISGRTVKNLLKLARQLSAAKNEPVTGALIKHVSRFLDVEKKADKDRGVPGPAAF